MTTYVSTEGPRDLDLAVAGMPRLVGPAQGRGWADDRQLPAPAAQRPDSSPPVATRRQAARERRGGLLWALCYSVTGTLTALVALTVAGLALAGFFSLPAVGTGLLLLVPAIWSAWLLGRFERHRIAAFLGTDIGVRPPSPAPEWRRVLGADETRLKALGWVGLHGLWGLVSGLVTLTVLSTALVLVSLPLWGWATDQIHVLGLFDVVLSTIGIGAGFLLGLVLLVLAPWLAKALSSVDVALARWLIGADAQTELRAMSARVETLRTTRSETLDSVEAERRRIERDLHDGPQQRLVSVAMNLGLARNALERSAEDPAAAQLVRDLLDEAHASSKEAITEMRQVARGIVPPILTDRGLDAAVSALANRSPVPVTVSSHLPAGRLNPTTEAVAYFCVSEALTNIAKHSRASRASVEIGTARGLDGELLALTVTDDGQGGAVVGAGSGLTGLRQRVAAVDGQVHVHSPVGSGTTVAITLPLRTEAGAR